MEHWKVNVPVYLNFFSRPETFQYVFDAVREAKPSVLFLSCDGARENRLDDVENIKKCQEIAERVDWECKVYKNYSEKNLGCGMRMYSGISWAFEYVDRLIILEDDCVPSQDCFRFFEELLERYLNDTRINMICGMNNIGTWDKNGTSYFFAKTGSCWGWATWKRAWENVEYDMPYMKNENVRRLFRKSVTPKGYGDSLLKLGDSRYAEYQNLGKLSAWTFQHGMSIWLNSQLTIVPARNMITNVGLTGDSTHALNDIRKLPRATQKLFNMKTYPLEFPITHPKYIIDDADYAHEVGIAMGGTGIQKYFRRFEGIVRRIIFAEKGELRKAIIQKVKRWQNEHKKNYTKK